MIATLRHWFDARFFRGRFFRGRFFRGRFFRGRLGGLTGLDGTSAVEFALIAPVTLLLLVGIVEAGRLFWVHNTLQFVAEETARYAMVNQSAGESELVDYAQSKLTGIDPATVAIAATAETVNGTDYVTIQATHEFQYLISLIPGGPIPLSGSSRVPLID